MSGSETCAGRLIAQFGLQPHPEGGYYRETYRSAADVRVEAGRRVASTAIYYLLKDSDYSAWHRIASDEIWHFYAGQTLNVYVLDEDGRLRTHRLGDPLRDPGCAFQAVVPAGRWFAAELASRPLRAQHEAAGSAFALVGCTVAPGFEFHEFELADAQALISAYPQHTELISRLAPARR